MASFTNIVRRPGSASYYVRLAIPKDLRDSYGRRELWKSLGTAKANEARALAAPILALWHAEFADRRRKHRPTSDDLQSAVWRHYQEELEHDRTTRAGMPKAADAEATAAAFLADVKAGRASPEDVGRIVDVLAERDAADIARRFREGREAELRKHLATGETALVTDAVDDVIQRDGLLIEDGSSEHHDLAHRLQRAELEALQRGRERDRGDWTGKPADPIVSPPPDSPEPLTAAPGETIMELYDRFKREKRSKVTDDTWSQNRKIMNLFAQFVGETAHISAVSRKNVRDWKQHLALWPVKAADSATFRHLSFRDAVALNEKLRRPAISAKTINKYLSALGSFATWLLANDYIADDVMKGMYLEIDKANGQRLPFDTEQLSTIFKSPLYTGYLADEKEHLPGNMHTRDWRFWFPLIALYTGARLGEIAQLLVTDVRQLHGTWIFHITEEGSDDKSTKTAGSMRVVPIHSELIRIGFLDYHARLKASGKPRLFPEIIPNTRGHISGTPSKFFNTYFRRIGVKVDKRLNFHSFRHGVADAFRRAGYLDEQFAMLLGHAKPSTTGRYGILPEGQLAQRVEMIEAITYPGLDLSNLP